MPNVLSPNEMLKMLQQLAQLPFAAPVALGQALIEGGQLLRAPRGLPKDPLKATAMLLQRGLPPQLLKGGEFVKTAKGATIQIF